MEASAIIAIVGAITGAVMSVLKVILTIVKEKKNASLDLSNLKDV